MTTSQRLSTALGPLRARWTSLSAREQSALRVAGWALAVLALWLLAVQPAWRTLRQAPAQIDAVERQLQTMQSLAAEARALKAVPAVAAGQGALALQAASDHLGDAARLSISGDRAVLTVNGIASEPLLAWLGEVRSAARARPVQAQLQRGPKGYSGTIVLALNAAAP